MKKLLLLLSLFVSVIYTCSAQDLNYAHKILDELCSPAYNGRGYVKNGDKKAADFVANEFTKFKLKKFADSYFQRFYLSANTFPTPISVKIDGTELELGVDYLPFGESGASEGVFQLEVIGQDILEDTLKLNNLFLKDLTESFIVFDIPKKCSKDLEKTVESLIDFNSLRSKGIIRLTDDKLSFSPAINKRPLTLLYIERAKFSDKAKKINISLKNRFLSYYQSQNVVGYIQGQTDSFIVFSAHYDHVGRVGQIYFPGAHDNASGVAMMLNLVKYYAEQKEKPHYSMAFMAFSGEEMGLVGSQYYTNNPLFPLNQIHFLVNLDLMGSGEEGIQIVNGSIYKNQFKLLTDINTSKNYLKEIKTRGEAANSDHYYFYRKGVPCFFIYTLGAYKEYHNIYDTAQAIPLNKFEDIFHLLTDFVKKLDTSK